MLKHPELKDSLRGYNNIMVTEGLFWEFRHRKDTKSTPIYTLTGEDIITEDGRTIYSAKKIYLECADITEYSAAMQLLGDWDHWKKLQGNKLIMEYIEAWREELEIKLMSQGLRNIVTASLKEDNTGLSAAKFLSKREWKEGTGKKRGRPSKEEVAKERRIQAAAQEEIDKDAERLGLQLN